MSCKCPMPISALRAAAAGRPWQYCPWCGKKPDPPGCRATRKIVLASDTDMLQVLRCEDPSADHHTSVRQGRTSHYSSKHPEATAFYWSDEESTPPEPERPKGCQATTPRYDDHGKLRVVHCAAAAPHEGWHWTTYYPGLKFVEWGDD